MTYSFDSTDCSATHLEVSQTYKHILANRHILSYIQTCIVQIYAHTCTYIHTDHTYRLYTHVTYPYTLSLHLLLSFCQSCDTILCYAMYRRVHLSRPKPRPLRSTPPAKIRPGKAGYLFMANGSTISSSILQIQPKSLHLHPQTYLLSNPPSPPPPPTPTNLPIILRFTNLPKLRMSNLCILSPDDKIIGYDHMMLTTGRKTKA